MDERRRCAFCGTNTAKISGEHIWSAWIGRLLGSPAYNWRFTDPETREVREWKGSLDTKVKVVCKPCNEGWMSQLESEAKRELSDVIAGKAPVTLSLKALATLAAFTFKGAVVANYMNTRREPFFPVAVRQRFMRSLEIPANVQMWLSAFGGRYKHGNFIGLVSGPADPNYNGPLKDFEFYAFTYSAGGLVVQLLASRWASLLNRGLPLPVPHPNPAWDTVAPQFWPTAAPGLDWPPPEYLDDDTIDMFINRWTNRMNFRRPAAV